MLRKVKICVECGEEIREDDIKINGVSVIYYNCENKKCKRYGLLTSIWNYGLAEIK